jgi:hypothetical protein
MATWRAFLAENLHKDATATGLEVLVYYYDADDPVNAGTGPGPPPVLPATILHVHTFTFPHTITRPDVQAAIITEGQDARGTVQRATTISQQVPAGSTLAIP